MQVVLQQTSNLNLVFSLECTVNNAAPFRVALIGMSKVIGPVVALDLFFNGASVVSFSLVPLDPLLQPVDYAGPASVHLTGYEVQIQI